MRTVIRTPSAPLSGFVQVLWHLQGIEPAAHARESLLPTGAVELVFSLRDERIRLYEHRAPHRVATFRGAVVPGPHSHPFVIDAPDEELVVGVHFRPGGAFPFLGLPAGELRDEHVGLEDLWGPAAAELRERLIEAGSPATWFRIIEAALLERAAELDRHPAVEFALGEFDAAPHERGVAEVTGDIGLSSRRFLDVFRDRVGLTRKLYLRVRRFQRLLGLIELAAPRPGAALRGKRMAGRNRVARASVGRGQGSCKEPNSTRRGR